MCRQGGGRDARATILVHGCGRVSSIPAAATAGDPSSATAARHHTGFLRPITVAAGHDYFSPAGISRYPADDKSTKKAMRIAAASTLIERRYR
jgi:hypothetical protein